MSKFKTIKDLNITENGIIPFSENEELEYKQTFRHDQIPLYLKILVAMANTNGGCIVFGVKKRKNEFVVEGLKSEETIELIDFCNSYSEYFDKEYVGDFQIEYKKQENDDGKCIALIFVKESPYSIIRIKDSKILYRQGINMREKRASDKEEALAILDILKHIDFKDISSIPTYGSLNEYYVLEECPDRHSLYKYMPVDCFVKCIENGNIMFQEPNGWNDQYERRYYKADYSNVEKNSSDAPELFATCFTKEKDCEASWKVYAGSGTKCVQLEIDVEALRYQLESSAQKGNNDRGVMCKVYEGQVSYKLSEKEILGLYKKESPFYKYFFTPFNLQHFIALLLYKRPAFEYEKEIRFFMVTGDDPKRIKRDIAERLFVGVDWKSLIMSVRIDVNCSDEEKKTVINTCKRKGIILKNGLSGKTIELSSGEVEVPLTNDFDVDQMVDCGMVTIE